MPNFNPSVPETQDPNWLGWSKAISQPEGNRALGQLFKGVGDVFSQGVKSADEYVQESAKNAVAVRAQPIVDENQEALTALDTSLKEGRPLTQQDLMDKNQQNAPAGVDRAVDKMQMLEKGKANGKFSETHYYGELYRVLKDVRSQFPGYRQYVDQEMERITGKNVANAYMSSMLSDINSYATNTQKEDEEVHRMFNQLIEKGKYRQTGGVGATGPEPLRTMLASDDLALFDAKKIDIQEAKRRINLYNINEAEHQNLKIAAERGGLEREALVQPAKTMAEHNIAPLRDKAMELLAPFEADNKAALDAIRSGKTPDPEAKRQMDTQMMGIKSTLDQQVKSVLYSNDPKFQINGHNLAYYFKDKKEVDDFAASITEPFDIMHRQYIDGDFGSVHAAANAAKDITSRDHIDILKDKDMGAWMRLSQQAKDISPEFQRQLNQWFLDRNFGKDGASTWIANTIRRWATGDPGVSLTDSVKEILSSKNTTPAVKAKMADDLITWTVKATDKSLGDEVRLNLVKNAIDPTKNLDLLKNFTPGGMQEKTFNSLTSSEFAQTVKELSGKPGGAGLLQAYKDFTLRSIAIMLPNEFTGLDELRGKIGWDNGEHNGGYPHFVVKPDAVRAGPKQGLYGQSFEKDYQSLVDRAINPALRNMADVAKAVGEPPNEFILKGLKAMQVLNPNTMEGLPREMYDAAAKHREIEQQFEEQKNKMTTRPKVKSKP